MRETCMYGSVGGKYRNVISTRHGTVRTQFLSGLDISIIKDIDELNVELDKYINRYNTSKHSSLSNKKPEDRFFSEPDRIRKLSDSALHYAFLFEDIRKVSVDRVVKLDGKEFEVPMKYIRQKVILRYNFDYSEVYLQDDKIMIQIQRLDKHANSKAKRERTYLSRGDQDD